MRGASSPKDYDENIGLYDNIDLFVSTRACLPPFDSLLIGSPSFDPDSFFAMPDPAQ